MPWPLRFNTKIISLTSWKLHLICWLYWCGQNIRISWWVCIFVSNHVISTFLIYTCTYPIFCNLFYYSLKAIPLSPQLHLSFYWKSFETRIGICYKTVRFSDDIALLGNSDDNLQNVLYQTNMILKDKCGMTINKE